MWAEEFAQLFVDDLVGNDEGRFVAIDHQSGRCQAVSKLAPCLDGAVGQKWCIRVAAIETNVIHPTVQVHVRVVLLEPGGDGL